MTAIRHRWTLCVAAIAVASCGGSTDPSGLSAAALATRFDALATRFDALATRFDALAARECPSGPIGGIEAAACPFIQAARSTAAEGVMPSAIAVSTSVGSGTWFGSVERFTIGGASTIVDTVYLLVAFDGLDVKHALIALLPLPGPWGSATLLDDTVAYNLGDGFGTPAWPGMGPDAVTGDGGAAVLTVGPACVPNDPAHGVALPNVCRTATFTAAVNATLTPPGGAGSSSPVQTIAIATQTMPGIVADSTLIVGATVHQ